MNKQKIQIDEKLNLVLPKYATFADISDFFEKDYDIWEKQNPQLFFNSEGGEKNEGYLMSFWLFEIYDSNSQELTQEIRELIENKSKCF